MSPRSGNPNVLCLSGHDPTGGAGLQADIETVAALGGHALTVPTAYTIQDTRNVRRTGAPTPDWLREQLACLLADCRPAAIKIGLLGNAALVPVIVRAVRQAGVPVVIDPVLRAGGGRRLAGNALEEALAGQLLPLATVATPNRAELMRLAPRAGNEADAARRWLLNGTANVLVTGGDTPGTAVTNTWYRAKGSPRRLAWPRIRSGFHGAGCTLAAAIATRLAQGCSLEAAIKDAQAFAHAALVGATRPGRGRAIPWRRLQA